MDSFERFNESQLPDKNKFSSSLKGCDINEKVYQRANNVWKVFKTKNLGECHDLYFKNYVLLLCEVFEKFIKTCLEYYGLDPSYCFSVPGLSFNAILKVTGIKLEKIHNIDVHLFLEKGIRGGISYISKSYVQIKIITLLSIGMQIIYMVGL